MVERLSHEERVLLVLTAHVECFIHQLEVKEKTRTPKGSSSVQASGMLPPLAP